MIGNFEAWKEIPEHFWCVLQKQEGRDKTVHILPRLVLFFHSWLPFLSFHMIIAPLLSPSALSISFVFSFPFSCFKILFRFFSQSPLFTALVSRSHSVWRSVVGLPIEALLVWDQHKKVQTDHHIHSSYNSERKLVKTGLYASPQQQVTVRTDQSLKLISTRYWTEFEPRHKQKPPRSPQRPEQRQILGYGRDGSESCPVACVSRLPQGIHEAINNDDKCIF